MNYTSRDDEKSMNFTSRDDKINTHAISRDDEKCLNRHDLQNPHRTKDGEELQNKNQQ